MNKKHLSIFLILILGFVIACSNSEPKKKSDGSEFNRSESEKLQKEVERIHDAVMPRLSEIEDLLEQIEILHKDSSVLSQKELQQLQMASKGLQDADKGMWDWMYAYKPNQYKTESQLRAYLVEERIKINKVKAQIVNSIEYAKSTLNQIEGNESN